MKILVLLSFPKNFVFAAKRLTVFEGAFEVLTNQAPCFAGGI